MKFHDLKEHDSSVHLMIPDHYEGQIDGISNVHLLKSNTIVFLKDKKYLNLFFSTHEGKESEVKENGTGTILSEKLWGQIKDDQEVMDKANAYFNFIAATPNVDLTMSFLSKPFYDLKYSGINDVVDGRQMDTAKVHTTSWIAQNAFIGESVEIGADVKIHPGAVIMAHAKIDDGCEIYPNVTVYPFTQIGKNCRIHANSTIGADGFGYNFDKGTHHKVWHMGGVIIEDDVEIGANSCVDQGTFSPTIIGRGSKLDNQVQIGHNSKLGMGTIFCGQAATAGSSAVGDFTVLGGKAAIAPVIEVGKACQIAGNAGVTSNWPDGSIVGGFPARPLKEWMKGIAFVRKESLKK